MRTVRLLGLWLLVLFVALPAGEAQTARQKKRKAEAAKAAAAPQIAVVGDADALEEYTEEDAEEGPAGGKPDRPNGAIPSPGARPPSRVPGHAVTVTCDRPDLVAGLPLRAVGYDPEEKLMRLHSHTVPFDGAGKCKLELPKGAYQFEVLGGHQDTVVALRTASRQVAGATEVALKASEPGPLELRGLDGAVPLRELAIRSASASGEVRWQAQTGGEQPQVRVALSPGQKYRVRALGVAGETAYAVWREVDGAAPRLEVTPRAVASCRFRWAAGGAPVTSGGVTLGFPESRLELPVTPETVLLTNRRFVTLSYWLETEAGRKVTFHERGYVLAAPGKSLTLELGGPLRPSASAVVGVDKRPRGFQVNWFVNLHDARGHCVDAKHSTIGLKATLRRRGGAEVPPAELRGEAEGLRTLCKDLEAVVLCDLDGTPVEKVLPLAPFVPRQSEHFSLQAPESWDWRADCYLAKCERIFRFTQELTGRNRKAKVHVSWHTSRVSLGGTFGIAMPLSGLRESFDWHHFPKPIIHEIHHAFGYPHGDAMRYAHKLVAANLRAYRWHLADHPEQLP